MPLSRDEKIDYLNLDQKPDLTREEKIRYLQLSDRLDNETKSVETEPSLIEQYGEKYIRPVAQGVGGALGAIAGAPLGPVGAVAGGGLGYGLGEGAYRLAKEALVGGEAKPIQEEFKKAAGDVLTGSTYEMGGQAIAPLARSFMESGIQNIGKGVAKSVYNIPEKAIEIYQKKPELVERMSSQSAFESGQKLLSETKQKIKENVSKYNEGLDSVLQTAENEAKTIDIQPSIDKLQSARDSIKPVTDKAMVERADIQRQIDLLNEYRKVKGAVRSKLTPFEANDIKRKLQAATVYEEQGMTFERKDEAAKAIKQAASTLREGIEEAVPGVKEFNQKLSELLEIQTDPKFQQAFKPEAIESTMKNLQSEGGNKGYIRDLVDTLDKKIGTNIGNETEAAYAAKYLSDNELLSGHTTGRSKYVPSLGMAAGGAVGAAIGGPAGAAIGAPLGYLAGGALQSPAIFKSILPSAQAVSKVSKAIAPYAEATARSGLFETLRNKEQNQPTQSNQQQYVKGPKDNIAYNYTKVGNIVKSNPQSLGKFARPLQEAASRSEDALAATHFTMYNREPEYRKQLEESLNEPQE